jgi:hypothetical protein
MLVNPASRADQGLRNGAVSKPAERIVAQVAARNSTIVVGAEIGACVRV